MSYIPGDEYDWDHNDDSQHCKHGTFIGSWAGPDLLCGWCEEGISDREFDQLMLQRAIDTRSKHLHRTIMDDGWFLATTVCTAHTFSTNPRTLPWLSSVFIEMGEWTRTEAERQITQERLVRAREMALTR